jgi:serine/threonine protein kinase
VNWDLTGQKLGRYVLREVIGRGGMAVVYRASQPTIGREVAVKVIMTGAARHPALLSRFEQGTLSGAKLQHPHILPIYDYGVEGPYLYVVTAYLPGGTLSQRIAISAEGLALEEVVRITTQLASALDYAHGRGVVHRDVKPGNVLLDGQDNAYLSDFGIAQLLDAVGEVPGVTFGTYAYMAPELVVSSAAGPASDIYALGVVIFEMLTGRRPFEIRDRESFLAVHAEPSTPDILRWRPSLPPGVRVVVAQAMNPDPLARPPHASALAVVLARAAGLSIASPTADAEAESAVAAPEAGEGGHAAPAPPERAPLWRDIESAAGLPETEDPATEPYLKDTPPPFPPPQPSQPPQFPQPPQPSQPSQFPQFSQPPQFPQSPQPPQSPPLPPFPPLPSAGGWAANGHSPPTDIPVPTQQGGFGPTDSDEMAEEERMVDILLWALFGLSLMALAVLLVMVLSSLGEPSGGVIR